MEWKAMKGITLTEVHRNVTITLTEQEALYLKSLVGKVRRSNLPHATAMLDLYSRLQKKFPELTIDDPWKHDDNGTSIAAAAVDWDELV